MRGLGTAVALVCLNLSFATVADGEVLSLLEGEDGPRPWGCEVGPSPFVTLASEAGETVLRVAMRPIRPDCLRQTWGTDTGDLRWTLDSTVRLQMRGSPLARNPHGGLLLFEGGGRVGGGDSHWILPIPGEAYASEEWQELTLGPLSTATNPDWAPDADGRLDPTRIGRILFVAQQEATPEETLAYTFSLRRLEAVGVGTLPVAWSEAEEETEPDHVTPVQRGFMGRPRAHPASVAFEDLAGWRVARHGGAQVRLVRSREEPCHEDLTHQAKLVYRSEDGTGWFELVPPSPVALPEDFNAAQLWLWGNNWGWVPDPTTPQVALSLRVRDATGQRHRLSLGSVDFRFYGMLSWREPLRREGASGIASWGGAADGQLHHPCRLEAIEVRNGSQAEERTIYLESVSFFHDSMELPSFRTELLEGLPFPTTPETIVPPTASAVETSLRQEGPTYTFTAEADETVVWRYQPQSGTLSDLAVRVGDATIRPCLEAGPVLLLGGEELRPTDARLTRELLACERQGETLRARWRYGMGADSCEGTLSLRAVGKSLVVEWSIPGGAATELALGHAESEPRGRAVRIPYLHIPGGCAVLSAGGGFASAFLDWHNTDSSAFYGASGEAGPGVLLNGGSSYWPLTDGSRNALRERLVLSASSSLEEVLPNVPNPPSTQRETLRTHLYTHLGGIAKDRFDGWLAMWRRYHRLGIEDVLVTHHEDAWTDGADVGQGPQEYTMCDEAAPEVGDDKLIAYCRAMRAMGYGVGLYENFTDYNPLGRSWDERNAARNSQGAPWRVWPPTYAIRPLKALEMALDYPRRVAAKFDANTAYRDCQTAYPPWGQVDFQVGSPEAGKFSQCFRSWGAIALDGHEAYGGPVFSEGGNHWFSAGLIDGNYAQIWAIPEPEKRPLLLDFDLRRLHPLEADIAMGTHWSWGSAGEWGGLAATIAYGHLGFQPFGDEAFAARYYYLIRELQSRYIMEPVESISYFHEGAWRTISEMLRLGEDGGRRVRVRYASGLEIAVNWDPATPWPVELQGQQFELAGYAWAAVAPDGFLEYCTEIEGRRIGFVDAPGYLFADGGGTMHDFGPIASDGAVVLRRDSGKLIPLAGVSEVAIALPAGATIEAWDSADRPLGAEVTPLVPRLGLDHWRLSDWPRFGE